MGRDFFLRLLAIDERMGRKEVGCELGEGVGAEAVFEAATELGGIVAK